MSADAATPLAAYPAEVRAAVGQVRAIVAALHAELPRYELVVWTAGNVSQRVPGADLFVIKPSGVSYDDLTPEAMVVCDLDGVLVDHELSGVVVGQTLATRPEDSYRALLEATAFGTRTIVEAFNASGVPVTELVVAGGLLKNALLMQIYADVTRLPLSTITSEQGPALGAAIHAAVAAGAYPDVRAAAQVMGHRKASAYTPIEANAVRYDALFAEYTLLHDYFGRGANDVMHRLKAIRRAAIGGRS